MSDRIPEPDEDHEDLEKTINGLEYKAEALIDAILDIVRPKGVKK